MIADSWTPPTTFTPMRQRVVAFGEDGKVGDCVRCCVAMLLGRPYEEVPHFVEEELQGKGNWFERLGWWMGREGYPVRLLSSYETDPEAPAEPGDWDGFRWSAEPVASTRGIEGLWIAAVKSKIVEGKLHAVLMQGAQVACDPSPLADDPAYKAIPYAFCGGEWLVRSEKDGGAMSTKSEDGANKTADVQGRITRHDDGTIEATLSVKLKPKGDGEWDVTSTFPNGTTYESGVSTETEEDAIATALCDASEEWQDRVDEDRDDELDED